MLMLLAKSKSSAKHVSQIAIATKSKLDACATKTFSLDEIAKELFVSKTEIIRYFKKAYNTTPYQYLLNIKINHAKIMLENGTYSVVEISNQLAFSNPYHFSKMFKQKVGISPSEYRKKHVEKFKNKN